MANSSISPPGKRWKQDTEHYPWSLGMNFAGFVKICSVYLGISLGWDSCVQGKSEMHFGFSRAPIFSVGLLAPEPGPCTPSLFVGSAKQGFAVWGVRKRLHLHVPILAAENQNHPLLVTSIIKCHHPLLGCQGEWSLQWCQSCNLCVTANLPITHSSGFA